MFTKISICTKQKRLGKFLRFFSQTCVNHLFLFFPKAVEIFHANASNEYKCDMEKNSVKVKVNLVPKAQIIRSAISNLGMAQ